MASFMLWVIIRVVGWSRLTIFSVRLSTFAAVLQRCGMLVLTCHQKGERLTLTADSRPTLEVGRPPQQLLVLLPLGLGDAGTEGTLLAGAWPGQDFPRSAWWRQCRSWARATDILGPLVLRQLGHVHYNAALIHLEHTGHRIDRGRCLRRCRRPSENLPRPDGASGRSARFSR